MGATILYNHVHVITCIIVIFSSIEASHNPAHTQRDGLHMGVDTRKWGHGDYSKNLFSRISLVGSKGTWGGGKDRPFLT